MSTLTQLIEAWDEGHREFAISMGHLPDEDLWKRPHPTLLSVGEIAGHIAYWQAVWTGGDGNDRPDLASLPIQSPLLNHGFRYFTTQIDQPITVDLNATEVCQEVLRVHQEAKTVLEDKEMDTPFPGNWGTWGNFLKYQVFHVAYHTGQIYSARHLLGHETEDN